MKRREFLKAAGVGIATSTIAAPAIAQSMPELKWRLTSSWPKSLDTLYGAAEYFAKRIAELTDNKFQIQVFAAGEIVPGLQVLDAVQNGTVEMGHTATYYYFGKDPTFTFGTALPFGLNTRQQNAWLFRAAAWSCSTTSARTTMSGACRRQYRLPDGRLVPQGDQVARRPQGPEVPDRRLCRRASLRSSASCRSSLPAATSIRRWRRARSTPPNGSVPTTTRSSVSYKVAKYYYYPGWWEGGAQLHNAHQSRRSGTSCRRSTRRSCKPASREAGAWMTAKYDVLNPAALKRLVAAGAELRPFPQPVMEACYKAANEIYAEIRREPALQEDARQPDGLPQRFLSVDAGGRTRLRQLHDAHAHASLMTDDG